MKLTPNQKNHIAEIAYLTACRGGAAARVGGSCSSGITPGDLRRLEAKGLIQVSKWLSDSGVWLGSEVRFTETGRNLPEVIAAGVR